MDSKMEGCDWVKISAVIPVYNTNPKHLKECIDSVFNQTYKPFEVVVVNDGSTRKKTIEFLNTLKDVVLVNQENKGIAGALNTGIKTMQGDWWAGLASDDVWVPSKLEHQVKLVEEKPEAKIVYANWMKINGNSVPIRTVKERVFTNLKAQQKSLINHYFATWSNLLIHKEVFDKVGLFNEEFIASEDYEFIVRASQYYLFYHVPKVLMKYRIHSEQLTGTANGCTGRNGGVYHKRAINLARKLFGG